MKYGVQILFDGRWIWIIDIPSQQPVLYETYEEAEESAKIWKKYRIERWINENN
jgi:hypothetical protein